MSGPRCLPAAGRLVGLDLGERRIGVAVCDSAQRLATAAATIVRGRDGAGDRARVAAMVEEYG
ncbi:MAG: Holliday junction resolvase RuvX, partial [Acidimicrobiales bacterium]